MKVKLINRCPVCNSDLHIVKLQCSTCGTTIENHFEFNKFLRLSEDQLYFVEVFLKSRGNFKEMERELGISYPTIRSRLDSILLTLGLKEDEAKKHNTLDVLDMLERGEITPDEAIKILKEED